MVRLLVKMYDFWFFFVCNLGFLIAVSFVLGNARIFAAFAFWSGMNLSILVDASRRGARSMLVENAIVLACAAVFLICFELDYIKSMRSPALIPYGAFALPAQSFLVSALVTLLAMIIRNIYRRRQAIPRRSIQLIKCVSYRCSLRLVPCSSSGVLTIFAGNILIRPAVEVAQVSPIQQLQCVLPIGLIDVRKTVVSSFLRIVSRSLMAMGLIRIMGAAAFTASLVGASTADSSRSHHDVSSSSLTVQLTAVALTAAFAVISASMYLRQVYKVLLSSFDFLYVSTLLTVIHVTACDFFQWHTSPCLVVLRIHWELCVDALSPLVKDTFRLHVRSPAVVIATAMAGAILLLHRMIVLDAKEPPFDRVLWSGTVFGNAVAFRVIPTFFDSMASVLVWSCRLLYRAYRFDADIRIVLDGPVAYTNYLSRPCQRRNAPHERVVSRQWEDEDGDNNNNNVDQSTQNAVAVRPVKAGG